MRGRLGTVVSVVTFGTFRKFRSGEVREMPPVVTQVAQVVQLRHAMRQTRRKLCPRFGEKMGGSRRRWTIGSACCLSIGEAQWDRARSPQWGLLSGVSSGA